MSPLTTSSPRRRWNAAARAPLFALLTLSSACQHRATPSVAWEGREFVEVSSLTSLPVMIQDSLGAQRAGAEGIADRGGRFNTTDVIEPGLPMRRFVVAGLAPDAAIVAYERGGRGYSVRVLLYNWSGSRVRRVRAWTTYDPPDGLVGLIKSVQVSRSDRPANPRRRPPVTHPRTTRPGTGHSPVIASRLRAGGASHPRVASPGRDSLAQSPGP